MNRIFKIFISLSLVNTFCFCTYSDTPDCVCENQNQTASNLAAYLFDDALMRNVEHSVELLSASNEVLRTRLELLSSRFDQQTDMLKMVNQKLNAITKVDADNKACGVISSAPIDLNLSTNYPGDQQKNKSCNTQPPSSCSEAASASHKSGIYTIQVDSLAKKPFLVACDEETQGGGWTIVQRRMDGSVDFYRDWQEYKIGFGKLNGEFFIGLERLHALTTAAPQELLIIMEDFEKAHKFAKYDAFAVGDESESYALKLLGAYSGDAGDSLSGHSGLKFSTKDRDNDLYTGNCAELYTGAWWYTKCHSSNLNGQYLKGAYTQEQYAKGVTWSTFRGQNYAMKFVQMMIRPKKL